MQNKTSLKGQPIPIEVIAQGNISSQMLNGAEKTVGLQSDS